MLIAWPWKNGTSGVSSSSGTPGVAEGDDPVQVELVQVGDLQAQHGADGVVGDPVRDVAQLRGPVQVAEAGGQQVLAVFLQQLEDAAVGDGGDLDQLGHPVADLLEREGLQEREVQDHVLRGVEGAEPVLGLAVVDRDLDRDAGVDEPDQRGGHPDVVGGAAEDRAGEPGHVGGQAAAHHQHRLLADQPELAERVDDPLHRPQRLAGFLDRDREGGQVDPVVVEVGAHLLAVQAVHGLVDHHQAAPERPVAVGDLGVPDREGAVGVAQRVVDLLVRLDVERRAGGRERRLSALARSRPAPAARRRPAGRPGGGRRRSRRQRCSRWGTRRTARPRPRPPGPRRRCLRRRRSRPAPRPAAPARTRRRPCPAWAARTLEASTMRSKSPADSCGLSAPSSAETLSGEVVVTRPTFQPLLLRALDGVDHAGPGRETALRQVLLEYPGFGLVHGLGVDGLPERLRVVGDPGLAAVAGEHGAVLVLVPPPVESVRLEGLIERLPLQFGRVGDGADRAEQESWHRDGLRSSKAAGLMDNLLTTEL